MLRKLDPRTWSKVGLTVKELKMFRNFFDNPNSSPKFLNRPQKKKKKETLHVIAIALGTPRERWNI